LKRAGAAAKKCLKGIDLTARVPPAMNKAVRAMMILGGSKERARIDASGNDGAVALLLTRRVAHGPIVKWAIRDGRLKKQEMRIRACHQ
jgi:hypothetical protein